MSILNKWDRYHVEDARKIVHYFEKDNPLVGGFDTETTGLHIKKDKPFLIVLGWIKGTNGRVFTFEPTPHNMKVFFEIASKFRMFIGHNIKYDLHMLRNIGYGTYVEQLTNLVENMVLARLSVEAIPARQGGDSLALKDLADRYVEYGSSNSETRIKAIKQKLKDNKVKVLSAALRQFPLILYGEQQYTDTGKVKYWGKGVIEKFLKDPTNDVSDLPTEVREIWMEWTKEHGDGEPTYLDIYNYAKEEMIQYAQDDVIIMLEFAKRTFPIIKQRKQGEVLKRENRLILPLYRMESVGLQVDRVRLESDRVQMKEYIKERRNRLYELAGEHVNCNQHKRIKQILETKLNIHMESSDDSALKKVGRDYPEAKEFTDIVRELRTLEKWYSTYILKIQKDSEHDGRFYTQINQASAVSGRVSSDAQQFPKKAIYDKDGNELFHPRNVFIPTDQGKDDGYNSLWYCDLSQIELRIQANYTLLVSGGDLNLCRAYFPFKCYNKYTGKMFDIEKNRDEWNSGEWIDENGNEWTPTDVHNMTTSRAFPDLKVGTKEFNEMRSLGKAFNFMSNYGGGKGAAMKTLDIDEDTANALLNGYNESFPHVRIYQRAVEDTHLQRGYVVNMYGRRYYIQNFSESYKLANYLIQGSAADDMKRIIIEVDELLKNYKSRLVLTIHDEIQIEVWKGEEHLIPKVLDIMEAMPKMLVPVVCDAEVTYTTWREAKEVDIRGKEKQAV